MVKNLKFKYYFCNLVRPMFPPLECVSFHLIIYLSIFGVLV
jgi:hypothetical protein